MTDSQITTKPTDRTAAGGLVQALVGLPLHACCATHCRDWSETQGGLLPPSEHSPGCSNFRMECFTQITYWTGATLITEWPIETEWTDFAVDDGDEPPTLSKIWMTRDQLDRLEEFAGP